MENPVLNRAKDRYISDNPGSNFDDQSPETVHPYIQEAIDHELAPILNRAKEKYESEIPNSNFDDLNDEDQWPYIEEAIIHQSMIQMKPLIRRYKWKIRF